MARCVFGFEDYSIFSCNGPNGVSRCCSSVSHYSVVHENASAAWHRLHPVLDDGRLRRS